MACDRQNKAQEYRRRAQEARAMAAAAATAVVRKTQLEDAQEIAARLGNIIYWLSVGIAIPCALFAAFMLYAWFRHDFNDPLSGILFLQTGAVSFGIFLIGRAARYILAGR